MGDRGGGSHLGSDYFIGARVRGGQRSRQVDDGIVVGLGAVMMGVVVAVALVTVTP